MNNATRRYFTVHEPHGDVLRIGAQIDNAATSAAGEPLVHLWLSNGGSLGGYRLSRFKGEKVNAQTIRDVLFPGNWKRPLPTTEEVK